MNKLETSDRDFDVSDCPHGRGSGRTQWMIDHLCDAVAQGQPKCRVFGHSMQFALQYLRPRIIEGLQRRGLSIDKISREKIEVDGSLIVLTTTQMDESMFLGSSGFGDFVDHYADGED